MPGVLVLPKDQFKSVEAAVASLESGAIPCSGMCAVYSTNKDAYFVLWPKEDEAPPTSMLPPTVPLVGSMNLPTMPLVPTATVGIDTNHDGKANYFVSGVDVNRDGIPDALESPVIPPGTWVQAIMDIQKAPGGPVIVQAGTTGTLVNYAQGGETLVQWDYRLDGRSGVMYQSPDAIAPMPQAPVPTMPFAPPAYAYPPVLEALPVGSRVQAVMDIQKGVGGPVIVRAGTAGTLTYYIDPSQVSVEWDSRLDGRSGAMSQPLKALVPAYVPSAPVSVAAPAAPPFYANAPLVVEYVAPAPAGPPVFFAEPGALGQPPLFYPEPAFAPQPQFGVPFPVQNAPSMLLPQPETFLYPTAPPAPAPAPAPAPPPAPAQAPAPAPTPGAPGAPAPKKKPSKKASKKASKKGKKGCC